jgi:hypothetical protein
MIAYDRYTEYLCFHRTSKPDEVDAVAQKEFALQNNNP